MKGNCILSVLFLLVLLSNPLSAQEKANKYDGWNFRISPYFWFVGFKGTIYRPPQPTPPTQLPEPRPPYEIDVSFRDISSNIKFAFMGAGEYRVKRFTTLFNITSLVLQGEAITPLDLVLQNITYRFAYVSGDWSAGYFIVRNNKLEISASLGVKYIYFDIGGSTDLLGKINFEVSRDVFWFDPILAIRGKYKPHPRIEVSVYGDTDGSVVGDDFNYQFIGIASFAATKWFLVSTGYRVWGLKVDQEDAIYDGRISGYIVRLGFQF